MNNKKDVRVLIEILYKEYYEYLYKYGISISRDEPLAQELVQETFLRASKNEVLLKSLPNYKVKAWLFRVLKNYFLDIKRKEKFTRNIAGDFEAYEYLDLDGPIDVQIILDKLDEDERQLIMLKYVYCMKSNEIAEKLNVPSGTVRFRLHKIIQKLRKFYTE